MAYSLIANDGNVSLESNDSTSTLEIKGNPETIVSNIIPPNSSDVPGSNTAYMKLFGTYIQFGSDDPPVDDQRCRIYIKY